MHLQEYFATEGSDLITPDMPDAITIPGAVAGWSLLHKEHGYMPWNEIFSPAIEYAKSGIHVHERVAIDWYKNINRKFEDPDTSDLFLKNGNEFKVTDKFRNLGLLETFKSIADEGFDGFYNGWVAKDIHEKLQSIGGSHTLNDFKNAKAEWVKPITGNYRNITIHECPPNGQGIVAVFTFYQS